MMDEVEAIGHMCYALSDFDRKTRARMLRFIIDKNKHTIDKEDYVI